MKKLFLLPQNVRTDDPRKLATKDASIVRNYLEFVKHLMRYDCPDYIYFAEDVDGGPSVRQAIQFMLNMDLAYRFKGTEFPFIKETFKYTTETEDHEFLILTHTSKFFGKGIASTPHVEVINLLKEGEVEKFVPKDEKTQAQMAALFLQNGTDAQVGEAINWLNGNPPPSEDGE